MRKTNDVQNSQRLMLSSKLIKVPSRPKICQFVLKFVKSGKNHDYAARDDF